MSAIDKNVGTNRIAALSPGKRVLLLGTVMLVLLLMLVAIAEVGVRTRMYVKYGTFWGFEIKALDPATGLMVPKPNFNSGPVRINSLGFRSPELVEPRSASLLRLAFLGGSTTFCQEVSSNELVWPDIVTRGLQATYANQEFDYINASATALTVGDSLINLTERVASHEPDIVVIYHAVNDIATNGAHLARQQGRPESIKQTSKWFRKLHDSSLLVELVYKNLLILKKQQQAADATQKIPFEESFMTERFRGDLQALVTEALKTAKLVVIPTFSNQLRREQSETRQMEAANTHLFHIPFFEIDDLLQAFDSYNAVIREFADNEQVLVIETESTIEGTAENFIDSVHFTDTGSTRIGELLTAEIADSPKFRALLTNEQ